MAPDGIVFALSNPDPEIHPDVAAKYAAVVATGRSDFPNQINNVLAFPGVFRGALDAGARRITETMKLAAAEAIFAVVGDDLAPDRIVPSPLDPRVGPAVAAAVAAAVETAESLTAGRRPRLAVALALADVAGCGGTSGGRVDRGRIARRRGIDAAGQHLRRGAAVLRHGRAVEPAPDPMAELDSGAISVVPAFTGRVLDTFEPGATVRAATRSTAT